MCHCTLLRALNDRLVASFRLGKYASMVGMVSLELTLNYRCDGVACAKIRII